MQGHLIMNVRDPGELVLFVFKSHNSTDTYSKHVIVSDKIERRFGIVMTPLYIQCIAKPLLL